jgi:hypothetical protein
MHLARMLTNAILAEQRCWTNHHGLKRGKMKITVSHAREFAGQGIQVDVEADAKESIRSVTVTLDGHDLDDTQLDPGTQSYTKSWDMVGQGAPGMAHELLVDTTDADLGPHRSVTRWTDVS